MNKNANRLCSESVLSSFAWKVGVVNYYFVIKEKDDVPVVMEKATWVSELQFRDEL